MEGRQNKNKEIFDLLVHFPHARNSQGWARSKSGSQNPVWLFHVGDWDPNPQAIPCFPARKLTRTSGTPTWRQATTRLSVASPIATERRLSLPSCPGIRVQPGKTARRLVQQLAARLASRSLVQDTLLVSQAWGDLAHCFPTPCPRASNSTAGRRRRQGSCKEWVWGGRCGREGGAGSPEQRQGNGGLSLARGRPQPPPLQYHLCPEACGNPGFGRFLCPGESGSVGPELRVQT